MTRDTLTPHGAAAGKALPAPRLRGTCLLCNTAQADGRPVSPRKGMPVTWICFGCIARRKT